MVGSLLCAGTGELAGGEYACRVDIVGRVGLDEIGRVDFRVDRMILFGQVGCEVNRVIVRRRSSN